MARRKKEPQSVHRKNISAAAEQLFMAKGIENTSMNDIAREHEEALLKLVVYEAVKAKSAEYIAEAAAADIDISETADARAKKLIDKEFRKHRI